MKKPVLPILISIPLLLSSCNMGNKTYYSYLPYEEYYKATLNYVAENKNGGGSLSLNWTVLRKGAHICDADYDVIYVVFHRVSNELVTDRTLMYVNGCPLVYADSTWNKETDFLWNWASIYGGQSAPGSFVYEATQHINGRVFADKYKKSETSEYIEYDFQDNLEERYKIANNQYYYGLYYHLNNDVSETTIQGTFNLGEPADALPDLDKITQEMITK